MVDIPRRILIHDQLVEQLREGIRLGRWQGELPAEAKLGREFQVSRMTLRKALAQLANEHCIELGGRGRFHRILSSPMEPHEAPPRTVRCLTPYSFRAWSTGLREVFDLVVERLSAHGYRMEVEHRPALFERFQPHRFEDLVRIPDTAAWLLCFSNEEILRWFSSRRISAVVLGRVPDGAILNAIHPDSEAEGRHAAGIFYARGHREVVYLRANLTSIGDRICSEVFLSEFRRLGGTGRLVTHDTDPPSVSRCMMNLLASKPRPTGVFVGCSEVAISVVCYLQAAGLRVPDDVSVISAWDDYHLDFTFPAISRYRTDGTMIGRRVSDMLLDVVQHGRGKVRTTVVIPDFVPAGSVAQAPS
ncbi:hypothetical protein HNR46_004044 [Haloferula luteola]|uniref:HTH gntR-type domain-containing protein n=1 Tax=Haloferula luteola TaxID=595692 RepID=A0A840V727_9BACT|nr:GntR family transcriptional regulator [Haloferula luteola]MBB5353782.1 hypothetical protein [Haloferula luteola]